MSIEVSGLTKIYGGQKAIDNISFKLNKGEIVGFLGPNGAGKSTTMKIITGFLKADSGEVYVSGLNVETENLQTKKKIGYLPESNPLYNEMYIREYLEFIFNLHELKSSKKNKIKEVIDITGLSAESKKKINQLSKGYKQRVGLAAALIHDPEVLILDEPTSGLDPNQIVEIREVIKNLGKDKTVLFSTHILQEVEAVCNRVIIINEGNIVADDLLLSLQTSPDQHEVIVTFKEEIDPEILSEVHEINKIDKLQNFTFRFQTSNPEIVRREIMQLSLKYNLNIISLQNQNKSLEEIFGNLTGINNTLNS